MSKVKCIALDLDGTALRSDSVLSPVVREAIKDAIDAGIEVMVASGRTITSIPEELLKMKGILYVITSNGAAIYTCPDLVCINQFLIEPEAVERIIEHTKQYHVGREAFIGGVPYADRAYVEDPVSFGAPGNIVGYVQASRTKVDDINAYVLANKTVVEGIDFIISDIDLREKLKKEIPSLAPGITVTSSVNRRIEAIPIEAGKKNALAFVLERIGITFSETAAFGDADNDAEMLHASGHGFAMANGTKHAKEGADYLLPSNDEDGVALGIRKILNEINTF